jgi:hypothetical protein
MTVRDGQQDVDPTLTEVKVKFDRAMRRTSFAVAKTSAVEMPKLGKVHFDETGTVLTIPLSLEPGKEYAFSLNWPGGGSFQSTEGVLLKHVAVKFRTRAK